MGLLDVSQGVCVCDAGSYWTAKPAHSLYPVPCTAMPAHPVPWTLDPKACLLPRPWTQDPGPQPAHSLALIRS